MPAGSRPRRLRGLRPRDALNAWHAFLGSERTPTLLLEVAVPGSVLAVGCVHLPALLAVSGIALLAAVAALSSRTPPASWAAFAPVFVLLFLAAYTYLQTIPLPASVLATMAPANADVWRRALLPFAGPEPSWSSVSLDPGASIVEALRWFTYACVFAAATVVASRRGSGFGTAVVFASGVGVALVTIAHGLAGATKVFGLYQPRFAVPPWHVGPLLNPNNLAGYLNLAAMCGLGLLLAREPVAPRWVIGLGVATIIGVDVTSASRGGVLVLPLGVLGLATVLALQHRSHRASSRRAVFWLVFCAVGGGVALAILGGTAETWKELYDKNFAKLEMMDWARPMVRDHPLFGIGRGAFESVFPAYRTDPGNTIYEHAECFPAQWIAEWGLPIGVATLAAFAWLFRPGRLGVRHSSVSAGVWVGVAILALHNMLDLALEVPGVMVGVAAALGSAWGGAARHGSWSSTAPASTGARRLAGSNALLFAGILAIGLAVRFGWHDVASDRYALYERYSKGDGARTADQRAALRAELRAAMVRHPAEPYFPLLGGLIAWVGKDSNPIPWLSRALERAPDNGRAHLLLADVLAGRNHVVQALMELRLAVERDQGLANAAARRAQQWGHSEEEILGAIPTGRAGAGMLEALASARAAGPARRKLLTEALARDPDRVGPHAAMASELVAELSLGDRSAMCAGVSRVDCIASLQHHAHWLEVNDPESSAGPLFRAQFLRVEGNVVAAEKLLAERCASVRDRATCLYARLQAAAESSPPTELPAAIREYLASRCGVAEDCADAAITVGDLEASRGEWGAALAHYARATRDAPTERRWFKLADAATRIGAHAQAADALERVARLRGGGDSELRKRIQEEREAALGGALR